jgi:DNA-binding NtrC family response regulator
MSQLRVGISDELISEQAQCQPKLADVAPSTLGGSDTDGEPVFSLRTLRAQVEVRAIQSALRRTGWNRKQAARLLKISYRGLLYKIHRHNIAPRTEGS